MVKEKILITGGTGMVGSAIQKVLTDNTNCKCEPYFVGTKDYNLFSFEDTKRMYQEIRPDKVIHLAAKVGGVKSNYDYIADFYTHNIYINTNVLYWAEKFKVNKLVSLLSTCVYPDRQYVHYPLSEDQLHLGDPHFSNEGYAYAKRMLDVQTRTYNKQYGTNFMTAIPNNIFGPNDNFDLENGHVIAAIIRKIWEAKQYNKSVTLWGDGSSLREFTYSIDIANALLAILFDKQGQSKLPINIGNTFEISIKNLANAVAEIFDYKKEILWDITKPKGQHKKPSTNKRFLSLSPDFKYTNFNKALSETCEWFRTTYPNIRGI